MRRGSVANRWLDRYIGVPVLYATSRFRRKGIAPDKCNRVGMVSNPALGDTLLNSAVVQDVREHYSDAELIYFVFDANFGAATLVPGIDRLVRIDLKQPHRTIKTIRSHKLDLMIDFTSWQRITAFYTAMSGAKFRIGFRTPGQHRHWHYDLTADHSRDVHELENFRCLVRGAGIETKAEPSLRVPSGNHTAVKEAERIIVFHPWASGDRAAFREWKADNWLELAHRLNDKDTLFTVTGGSWQLGKSEDLCRMLRAANIRAQTYVSADGFAALCKFLERADLMISVNTGIMHLAAILGVPTVAMNGPTSTLRWGPIGRRVASVEPEGGGGGYLHLGFEFSGQPKDCMDRIRVDDVLKAAMAVKNKGCLAASAGVSTL